MAETPVIGILAVQGAFAEHEAMFRSLDTRTVLLRKAADLDQPLDALVLPGGESTAQAKILHDLQMFGPLREKIAAGLPTFGTCAGMILLAKQLTGDPTVHFGLMDMEVRRNAYGRQLGSFTAHEDFGDLGSVEMTFIRAPYIERLGEKAQCLATVDGHMVAARQNHLLAVSFHPELTACTAVHRYFLDMVQQAGTI